jgi:molybdate/tungstate transport system substrate-binding protein
MRKGKRAVSRIVAVGAIALVVIVIAVGVVSLSPGAQSSTASSSTSSAAASSSTGTTPASSTTTSTPAPAPLITFNADAYTAEVQALLNGFNAATATPVAPTHPAGSFALAKQIVSGSQVDVFIPVALSAAAPSNLKNFSSNWAIGFASDQMVIAYSNASTSTPAAQTVISEYQQAVKSGASSDWNTMFASLTSGGVKVGISDPNADPAGLRGWLVLEAAGSLYGNGNQSAYIAPLLQARANVTGSAAANMVAPLQAGQFQFLFIYRSVAIAQRLGYIQLDHRVNLGDPTLAASYAQVTYKLATGVSKGAPIILCMTIPNNAPHASEAIQFVQYVAKSAGSVVTAYGLQAFPSPLLYNNTAPPQFVAQMLSQGLVAQGGSLGQ